MCVCVCVCVCVDSSIGVCDEARVPVAKAGGKLSLKVTIKQNDSVPGPKMEVSGFLGSLHFLLSPHQLKILREMASDIASQGEGEG